MIELINEIIKNGGASLDASYNIIDIKKGYSVSILGYEKTFTINNLDYDAVIKNLKEYKKIIENKKDYYIGFWLDNDILYLDISKTISNYKSAVKFGVNNKQKAIFNNKNKKSIELVKHFYIIYKYDNKTNDIKYITELENTKEVVNYFKKDFSNKYILHNISKNIDNLKVLFNDYIILKDKEYLYNL